MLLAALMQAVCIAQPAASQPTTPASQPVASVVTLRAWLDDLSNTDPDVRDGARMKLMGIGRAGLDDLREAVIQSRPLAPSQTAVLQEIVDQDYLTGEKDDAPVAGPDAGFLGVQITLVAVEVASGADKKQEEPPIGLRVALRILGFCGYRMLEDGDVILSLTADKKYPFQNPSDLSVIVSKQHGGDAVTLEVLRRGKLIQVPVILDRRPAWLTQLVQADYLGEREHRAAEYWDQTFAPLLKGATEQTP